MSRQDYRLDQLNRDRVHREGDRRRAFRRRASEIRRTAESNREAEHKLALLRDELGGDFE